MSDIKNKQTLARKSYQLISSTAGSNSLIQGISGIAGLPWTLVSDAAVLVTHYSPMINSIRELYDRDPVDIKTIVTILNNAKREILFDILMDKVLGNIPVMGVYFNLICAKAMTWRIGSAFAILSSRGNEIDPERVCDVMKLVRCLSPQNDVFKFIKPSYKLYEKVMVSVYDNSSDLFESKIDQAINLVFE